MYTSRLRRSGVFALGAGTLAYIYHKKHTSHTLFAAVNQKPSGQTLDSNQVLPQNESALSNQNGNSNLRLRQVQVMFRHGARTPLHIAPKIPEANFDPQFIMREHQASIFPTERVLYTTGEPADWSSYEVHLSQTPLKSGIPSGALTAYGKDQVYTLGRRLQNCYKDALNLTTFSPEEVLVLSSNIKRTVESAQCVLAGFYSKQVLQEFVRNNSPIKIYVMDKSYNFLVPDTYNCAVLQKVNHAGMLHSDFIPGYKSDRLKVEKDLNDAQDKNMEVVKTIQTKINKISGSSGIDGYDKHSLDHQQKRHEQPLQRDTDLHYLIEERGKAIDRLDRTWAHAICRHPQLAKIITENDWKALVYLRRLEVEKLDGQFNPGYRFHFYFNPNQYFSNEHLCKDVYLHNTPGALPSRSEPIIWKEYGKQLQEEIAHRKTSCKCQAEAKQQNQQKEENEFGSKHTNISCTCDNSEMSFFQWYSTPSAECDQIWKFIKDDVWNDPVKCLQGKNKYPDKWERSINFVFTRDDLVARVAHGLSYSEVLKKYEKMIDERATTMLLYAMNGQHQAERAVVSRLCAGPFLTKMVEEFDKIITGKKSAYKLCLYSTHDSTISGVLVLFGIWDDQWPPFAADVRLELYQDIESQQYFVRVLYCGKVQKICGRTEELLPWSEFIKVISKNLIQQDEYKRICASDILERFAKDLLKHEEGEIIKRTEAPAGM